MSRKHTGVYKPSYSLQNVLLVVSRTPSGLVNSARCRFCIVFRRDHSCSDQEGNRKRARADMVTWNYKHWRTDMISSHQQRSHSEKWNEFMHLCDEEKMNFFNTKVPFAETISAHFEGSNSCVYEVHAGIVDEVIKSNSVSDESEHGFRHSVLDILERVNGDRNSLRISNETRHNIIIMFVDNGKFFMQAAESVRAAREVGNNPNFSGVTETTVRQSVQATICNNLQRIRSLLFDSRIYAFSIAFDAETIRENAYLDVRIRFCVHDGISNLHFLALPFQKFHTGLHIFEKVYQLLEAVLGACWKNKLLSASKDGASNMTGRVQGAVTRFQQPCLPGFFRIWYANHQLDLFIQTVIKTVMQVSFRADLLSLIFYLRRQTTLRSQMRKTFPAVVQKRWLSFGSATTWLTCHRSEIEGYLLEKNAEEKNADLCPARWWWLAASTFKMFIYHVNECSKAMQERDTPISQLNEWINSLLSDLGDSAITEGSISGLNLLSIVGEDTASHHVLEIGWIYLVRKTSASRFLEDSSFNSAEDLADLSLSLAADLEKNIAELFFESFVKISELQVQRSGSNGEVENHFLTILLWDIFFSGPRNFFAALKM